MMPIIFKAMVKKNGMNFFRRFKGGFDRQEEKGVIREADKMPL